MPRKYYVANNSRHPLLFDPYPAPFPGRAEGCIQDPLAPHPVLEVRVHRATFQRGVHPGDHIASPCTRMGVVGEHLAEAVAAPHGEVVGAEDAAAI